MLDALIVVSSDPRYDSRSSKYLSALLGAGLMARVIGISSDGTSETNGHLTRIPMTRRSGKGFFLQFYQRIIPEIMKTPAKIVIAGDLFSLPPAIIHKCRHSSRDLRVRLIYDSKELYEELPSLKRKRSSFFFWTLVEKSSVRYVSHVITVNESIADILERNWRLPTTVIRNVPEAGTCPGLPKRSLDNVMLAFSGGLQEGRGLYNLIRLLTVLPPNYELSLLGDGPLRQELEDLTASLRLSGRVHFLDRVKNEDVVDRLSSATIGIYLMENTGLCHYYALPNKLFQFISARLPVVVPTFPEMERIVATYDIGAAVDPTDIRSAASKVLYLTRSPEEYQRLVENCDKASKVLNWQVEKEKFLELIKKLI